MNRPPLVQSVAHALLARRWMLATAESCTGGLIAGACTELPGSSDWFERGMVAYSDTAKSELLGVAAELIHAHGAVSEAVALAMAQGARARASVQASLAVTGIAGPGGGSASKPVGTVWFGWCVGGVLDSELQCFAGNRAAVREQTVVHALRGLLARLPAAA